MKVNIILPSDGLSGGVRIIYKYAEMLQQGGHDVQIYIPLIEYDLKRNVNYLYE